MAERLVAVFTPFEKLADPRIKRSRRHELFDVVVVALCATLAGSDTWADIVRFGKARIEWLRTFLRLENGIPSHDTFGRVFSRLDPARLLACIQQWLDDIGLEIGKHIAIDGKTLRRSFDTAAGKNPLHLVSAWACETRLTLGQVATDAKSNEITAIPLLLESLNLKGATVTIDAMGCQKEIAEKIVERQGDYLLALKDNKRFSDTHKSLLCSATPKPPIGHNAVATIAAMLGCLQFARMSAIRASAIRGNSRSCNSRWDHTTDLDTFLQIRPAF